MSEVNQLKAKIESAMIDVERTLEPLRITILGAVFATSDGDMEKVLVCVGKVIDLLGTARAITRDLESQLLSEPFASIVLKPGKMEVEP